MHPVCISSDDQLTASLPIAQPIGGQQRNARPRYDESTASVVNVTRIPLTNLQ
jgi:hypothetical protein